MKKEKRNQNGVHIEVIVDDDNSIALWFGGGFCELVKH